MSLAQTELANGNAAFSSGSLSTASISPASNAQLIAYFCIHGTGTVPPVTPIGLTGNGLTWTNTAQQAVSNAGNKILIVAFTAQGASPSSGVLTLSTTAVSPNSINALWSVQQWTGCTTSSALVQHAIGENAPSGTATVTLSAFGSASNGTSFGVGQAGTNTMTASGALSSNTQNTSATNAILSMYQYSNNTTPTCTFTSSGWAAIGFEIKAGASGPTNPSNYWLMFP